MDPPSTHPPSRQRARCKPRRSAKRALASGGRGNAAWRSSFEVARLEPLPLAQEGDAQDGLSQPIERSIGLMLRRRRSRRLEASKVGYSRLAPLNTADLG